jgi:uncharacterized membrane protein
MENEHTPASIFGFAFSSKLKEDVRVAAIWAQIVAIIGFISASLSFVVEVVDGQWLAAIITTGINVLINVYLINFAIKTKKAIENVDQNDVEDGFNNLRLYFKVYGIIIIVALGIVLLAFIVGLLYMGRF